MAFKWKNRQTQNLACTTLSFNLIKFCISKKKSHQKLPLPEGYGKFFSPLTNNFSTQ